MLFWYIILAAAVIGGFTGYYLYLQIEKKILAELKEWKIGDAIIFCHDIDPEIKNNQHYNLLGWTRKEVYIDHGGYAKKIKMYKVAYNKSYEWRKNHQKCFEFMGKNPDFVAGVINKIVNKDGTIPDPSVMSETECEVYLKIALKEKDYNLAEAIRKRMERFK